ncbi:MAG TPA: DEAD/DEAH box helicase, partial [Candidatus Baltobacteraceae bacterium]|nr:DEAD/DEAH box helicase [Candidatus Baltobacteraceae bacterium]
FIQGPPGSGKSTVAAAAICDLLHAGKRVGVLSTGHKAIHHLLHKVEACARERGFRFRGLYKHSEGNGESQYRSKLAEPMIDSIDDNDAIEQSDCGLVGGTSWLFSREGMTGALDYLFVDEAGQVSLADAVAVSAAARNVVLLGDPSQLAQVSQGAHPVHAGDSVLEHLLGDRNTIPPDRGIFLDVSYRMHPDICDFVSTSMYDGRLQAWQHTARQQIHSTHLRGSGLRYAAMRHEGNSRESREEADWIAGEIAHLLEGTLTDCDGLTRRLAPSDVIVVTPYNAQRRLISRVLRDAGIDVAVGTVDKFQGQEAYVVFYSMATSSGSDLPRDIDFLFDRNRFNVAVSRARALAVLVASERLADIRCTSVEQIATLSLMCGFIERAEPLACIPAMQQSIVQTST